MRDRSLPNVHDATGGRCRALGLCSTWCRYRLHEGPDRCALDVAGRGGLTLEGVAACFGVTRERIRQIETGAAQRFRRRAVELGLEVVPRFGGGSSASRRVVVSSENRSRRTRRVISRGCSREREKRVSDCAKLGAVPDKTVCVAVAGLDV